MANDSKKTKRDRVGESQPVREELKNFDTRVKSLVKRGFSVLGPTQTTSISLAESSSDSSGLIGGAAIQRTFNMFDESVPSQDKLDDIGTKGLGYIPWGPNNQLPSTIYNLVASLPYTSSAIKYIVDLTVGSGPALMYRWVRYVNGTVKEEFIPYENAGVLIANRMREIRDEIEKADKEDPEHEPTTISWKKALGNEQEHKPEPGTREYELEQLKVDYASWTATMSEYEKFLEDNNLGLHYLKCMIDDGHMDIYFPTIGLSIGRAKEDWEPKIVRIGHKPAACVRMEQMDDNLRMNYVYYSEQWRGGSKVGKGGVDGKDIVAYPALMPENMLTDLRRMANKNRKTSLGRRPTWFCCPTYYPSMSRPYYPQPAWWSIFASKAYDYASTLITDKATMRQNSTMWGKIIFINNEYLRAMFDEQGADTAEEKAAVRNQIYNNVNELLRSKENNGKTICLDMFLGADGKTMQHAVEIVDVPKSTNGKDMKDELEEISSIIFFAIGVHPALIGAVPGKNGSTGGTYQRELHLLKQNQVSPRQRIYLKWLQNIHAFNGWDKHGLWVIKQPVLTTLDRNSGGVEETESK